MFSVRIALVRGFFVLATTVLSILLHGAELSTTPPPSQPRIAPASNEGELAMKAFQLQPEFRAELFAAEPYLANPVAFHIDNDNRFFVSETFRLHAGVTDIRGKMSWLDEDLASRSADERLAMMKRHEGAKILSYEQNSDRVKLILDKDRDGKADSSSVFADGFNHALDGIASGVLSRDGNVYFANLPNLWLLKDVDGDGVADQRRSLHYGYGVRVGFLGHDLHGLIMGPDGRLYFTIGDRGSNIQIDGKQVGDPETGSVFRCDPDGSNLEVFATGLRNPQEIAFDQYGNLFTGDNNSDGGDRARLVYLVKGGDSGWRVGYQFIERPNSRGPWNSERMWHPQWEGQPAFLVPPIANLTDGPSGFAYYPGTGLPEKYDQNFFLVDFHGGKGSGIYSFTLVPKGSFFELTQVEKFVWEALPTDVAFGPEPGLYFTDWVQGWGMTGKGRIYRVFHPEAADSKAAADTRRLLTRGFDNLSFRELERLLGNKDMRVRQEAQFELASRGARGADVLARVADRSRDQLARLHGIWGLGHWLREAGPQEKARFTGLYGALLKDQDAEVRTQSAKVVGDAQLAALLPDLIARIADNNARVRVHASIAAGDLHAGTAVSALLDLLRANENRDPVQRHAASYALASIGDVDSLLKAADDPSDGIRMGVLLALRRLDRAEIARFLQDSNPLIVAEAARAINDLPISGAIPELAALALPASSAGNSPELLRRVVNANLRFGTAESASTLGKIAADETQPAPIRREALAALANWTNPSGRDPVTGLWRPVAGSREERHAITAIEPALTAILSNSPDEVRSAAARAAGALRIVSATDNLRELARSSAAAPARVEALRALGQLGYPRLAEVVQSLQSDPSEEIRKEALRMQSQIGPAGALDRIQQTLQNGTLAERQSAMGTLANIQDKAADEIIGAWMDRLLKGEVAKELQLDVLEAAAKRDNPEIKTKLVAYDASTATGGEIAPFAVTLHGGNKEEGKKIFFERAEAACMRCHKIQGENSEGGEVGPELSTIGSQKSREYLLESIIFPNKHIAEGFESLMITTKDGTIFAGTVTGEDDKEVHLLSPEDGEVSIEKANITARQSGLSSMPEGLATLLSKEDLRDLVEYLASLK